MHIRLAVLATVLCGASYSCATPPDQPASNAGTATSAPEPRQGSYRTGSRLPSYEDKGGSSSVGDASRDDYQDEMRRGANPMNSR